MPAIKINFITYLLVFLTTSIAQAQIVKVIDGDTIHLDGEKIRFSGIDAPEMKQTCFKDGQENMCGNAARDLIQNKIGNLQVECVREGKDQYQRTLAECFVMGESLSQYLVRQGYAFAYRQYSKKFIPDEDFARENSMGMWDMTFDFPWDFRKAN